MDYVFNLNPPQPKPLAYLDPECFVSPTAGQGIDQEFICVICTGVVLDPTECKECQSLYCRGCLKSGNMPCPKRCGSTDYTKVNRLIMNALNKLQFRCQYSPKCEVVTSYDQYVSHYQQCPEGKPKECENVDCQNMVRNLQNQINQLKEQLQHVELQKDRNATVMRNQIQEMKAQIKNTGSLPSDVDQQKVIEELKLKIADLEAKLATANQSLQISAMSGVATKMNITCCPNQHPLKQKSTHPFAPEIHCDICYKGNLLHMPYFFRCDFNCNNDICAFCYLLMLTDQKGLLDSIKQHAMQARLQQQQQQQVPPPQNPFMAQPPPKPASGLFASNPFGSASSNPQASTKQQQDAAKLQNMFQGLFGMKGNK